MSKPAESKATPAVLISSDSHVIEPADLLKPRVRQPLRDRAPLNDSKN